MPRAVLVIDDSPSMRQLVSFTLRHAGFSTVEAGDGQEALQRLDQQRVDLVITDLNMPRMNGIEFIRELRRKAGWKLTPVLVLTTESQETMRQQARAAGATGWIVKPFEPARLIQVIGKVLP